MEEIIITTPYIKLDQFLKFANIAASGGEARLMVEDGIVFINGEKAFQRGKKLRDGDIVKIIAEDCEPVFKITAEKDI